ncbi:MAG: hypothetical protein RLZZ427_790 [Pseudomonadota bacterium]
MGVLKALLAAAVTALVAGWLAYLVLGTLPDLIGLGRRQVRARLARVVVSRRQLDDDLTHEAGARSHEAFLRLSSKVPPLRALNRLAIRAGREQQAVRYLSAVLGCGLCGGLVPLLAGQSIVFVLVGLLLGGVIPLALLSALAGRRRRQVEGQIPEALDFMSRAMRAGHGLTVALGMMANEMSAPIGPEFRAILEEINFGIPFHQALPKISQRIDSPDIRFFVSAILIQRETGGNLVELLQSLSHTVRERLKLQGRIRVLASEGKASGLILGAMPVLLGGGLAVANPDYMSALWTTDTGVRILMLVTGLMVGGILWMWKITQVNV